jgi:hypothetical protein
MSSMRAMLHQIGDEGVMRRVVFELHALDEKAGNFPERTFDAIPAGGNDTESRAAGEVVPKIHRLKRGLPVK